MATKEPITREEYDALLAEGISREEINAEFVIAPTAMRTPPKQRQNFGGYTKLADAGRLFAQGASFNMGDRARALLRSMSPKTTYAEALPEEQAKTREARANVGPAMAAASELSGALLVPGVGALKGVQSLMSAGGRLGAREVAKRIGVGAGIGAAEAAIAGAGESAPGEMLQGAARAAPIGAAGGALLTALPPAARSVRRYFGGGTEGRATEAASDALRELAARAGLSPEDYIKTVVRPGASGRRFIDADVASQELGVDAARTSPKAGDQLQRMAEGRIATQNADIADDVRTAVGATDIPSDKARASVMKRVKRVEAPLYRDLWKAFPDPIATPEAQKAWVDAVTDLKPYTKAIARDARLTEQSLDELLGTDGPTLQGLHRLKANLGKAVSALKNREAKSGLQAMEASEMRALTSFVDRLDQIIKASPGGQQYEMIQEIGARGRQVRDALQRGENLLDESTWQVGEALKDAQAKGAPVARGLRQGVGSAVTAKAQDTAEDASSLLNQIAKTPGARERVEALALDPQRGTEFQQAMRDRVQMAETNRQQTGSRTLPKPILQGARNRSTALQFGESMALGDVAGLQSPSQPLRMAFGSLLAKALQGRRYVATERAAELLAELLQRSGNDPRLYAEYTDLARALERINAQRLDRAALTSILGGQLGAQEGASR